MRRKMMSSVPEDMLERNEEMFNGWDGVNKDRRRLIIFKKLSTLIQSRSGQCQPQRPTSSCSIHQLVELVPTTSSPSTIRGQDRFTELSELTLAPRHLK
jgi:hypothetical protein